MFPPTTRILLVEDMASIREIMIETFHSIGFKNIVTCKDGAEAWEQLQNASPPFELVVSDMNMPVSSGLDLLARIRSAERFQNLPFMMISEVSDQSKIIAAIKSGADYYLVKPVEEVSLNVNLKKIFDKRNGVSSK
jgi:two-component system chemotaxis response regulator CheY